MTTATLHLPLPRSLMEAKRRNLWMGLGVAILVLAIGIPVTSGYKLWPYVINGISDGSIYAMGAVGLVLTYKTSGIFNFAIGAQAAASAYVFYTFRVTEGWPWPIAALMALFLVAIVGSFILERLAFLLTEAPPVMRVVASIGLLVLLQSLLTGAYGQVAIHFPTFLPQKGFHVGGINILGSQIIIAVISLTATIGLSLFFRRARLGVAMQAVVENSNLLALEATSPIVVRRYAWIIGGCFISISGMLIAPEIGIDVNNILLLYIAAFGAAAVGGFSSLPIAFGSAIGIGIAMNVMSDELAGHGNATVEALYTQVPFLVLVLALLFISKDRLIERGAKLARRIRAPKSFPPVAIAGACAVGLVVALFLPKIVGSSNLDVYTTGVGFAIILASLGLVLWTSGQISLCQMAFAAVGATTFVHAKAAGLPWLVALLAAGLVAVPVGALVAIPSFRLSGIYLAAATFAFGLLFQNMIYNTFLMFGVNGQLTVPRPHFFGTYLGTDKGYYYLVLAVAVLCMLVVVGVQRSRLGRLLRGLSDSPTALDAHGANTKVTRLFVFCIAAFLAAIGGALIGGVTQFVGSSQTGPFSYFNSLALVAVLAFCGRRLIFSAIVAAFIFEVLKIYRPFNGGFFTKYEGVVFGVLAIGVAVAPAVNGLRLGKRGRQREGRSPVKDRDQLLLEGGMAVNEPTHSEGAFA
jgi:branched-subunit amino acid ABC-type transport system permease component